MKKILVSVLLVLISFSGNTQTLLGNKLCGDSTNDQFGENVAISDDGKTIITGSRLNSHNDFNSGSAAVYKYVGNNWIQEGPTFYGTGFLEYFGRNVAMSGDGSIIAISALETNSTASGEGAVYVYQNLANNWVLLGQPILGQNSGDLAGSGIELSTGGNKIAITSPGNTNNGSSSNASGQVRVFEYVSNNWTQLGQDINGDTTNNNLGYDVSMSSDGKRIAVSGICNSTGGVNACVNGFVQVYEYMNNSWTQIGQTLNGLASDDRFGKSIALSGTGNTLVVGACLTDISGNNAGTVTVYDFSSNSWGQAGSVIHGSGNFVAEGWQVSITDDGNVFSTGSSALNYRGQVKLFKRGLNSWNQIGNDINGDYNYDNLYANMISADGSTIVVGAWGNDSISGNAGQMQVFDLRELFLGIEDLTFSHFSIYPNPASDYITIELQNGAILQNVNLYNSMGQLIKTTNSEKINISDLSQGTYFVEVITGRGKTTQLLTKK